MATTPTSESPDSNILVQTAAWGYVLLSADHSGVRDALKHIFTPANVHWGLLSEIAQLAGHTADDMVIAGGTSIAEILEDLRDTLVQAAIVRERERNTR